MINERFMHENYLVKALTGLLILSLLGAGCKAETKVDVKSDTSITPVPAQQEESLPIVDSVNENKVMEEPKLESENDNKADTSVSTDLDIKVESEITPPPVEVKPESETKVDVKTEPEQPKEPELKVFNITAKQWEFSPAVITVNQGDHVKIHVTSSDVQHGIAILTFGVSANLQPGQTATLDFIADKKGTFSMICTVFCGSGHGSMKGSLIVQ
jgi:cytochrome c oxidase subunit 2